MTENLITELKTDVKIEFHFLSWLRSRILFLSTKIIFLRPIIPMHVLFSICLA